ncbi:hypothetical protein [Maritalea myrionectae]|uniref:hypothetical protein n=1 Tax=Maritalea myrionectae TaxID=454601 RepID=UPI000417DF74|nr:hypothetical protein [Maritalea myrionectae]
MVDFIKPPGWRSTTARFEIVGRRSNNQLRAGKVLGYRFGASYWAATVSTPNLDNDEKDAWRSFFDYLNEEGAVALLADPQRLYPKAYDSFAGMLSVTTDPFDDGLAKIFSIQDRRNLTIYELPTLFELKQGDYVEVRHGERRYLHRIADDVTGDAGGAVSIKVRPPLLASIVAGDIVSFKEPTGEFIVEQSSISGIENHLSASPISFSAISRAN